MMSNDKEYAEKCIRACAGLPDGALDGGWTAAGMGAYAKKLEDAIAIAYGHLWHVNNEPMAPKPTYSPEAAAYEARKVLRDLLTNEQRGTAINNVQALLGHNAELGPNATERISGADLLGMLAHAKEAENYVLACVAYVDRLTRAYLALQVENVRLRDGTKPGEAAARDLMQRANLAALADENERLKVKTTPLSVRTASNGWGAVDHDGNNVGGGCSLEGWLRAVRWTERQHGIGA